MQAVARCTPVVGRARRYRSQPLKTGPCAAHPRRSRGCAERGPHERLANPRSLGRATIPQRLQRKIGSAPIKLEQTGALRRCPPPFWQPHPQHPGLRAKRVSCDTPPCHPHSFDEELGGSAAQPRRHCILPARHLDGAAQPLQADAGGRVLLVDPLALGVLRGRGADLQAGWPRRELRAGEAAARRSCGWSRAKSWRRRRRRPRKPTRARLWRGHAVLSTSKQRLGCV